MTDHTDSEISLTGESDSVAEEDFIAILEKKSFQKPDEAQYRIDLGNGEVTIANYAYAEAKVLIFIDGLSDKLHCDPAQSQKDRLLRAKAQMQGYQVVSIPAASLKDETMVSAYLDELAVYLGG